MLQTNNNNDFKNLNSFISDLQETKSNNSHNPILKTNIITNLNKLETTYNSKKINTLSNNIKNILNQPLPSNISDKEFKDKLFNLKKKINKMIYDKKLNKDIAIQELGKLYKNLSTGSIKNNKIEQNLEEINFLTKNFKNNTLSMNTNNSSQMNTDNKKNIRMNNSNANINNSNANINNNKIKPLQSLVEKIKDTTNIENNRKKLHLELDKIKNKEIIDMNNKKNIVQKLYDYIIAINNSFTLSSDERKAYLTELINKLNNDKKFIEELNIILSMEVNNKSQVDTNLLNENIITNNIKDRIKSFQKISRNNANKRLNTYISKNDLNLDTNNQMKSKNTSILGQLF